MWKPGSTENSVNKDKGIQKPRQCLGPTTLIIVSHAFSKVIMDTGQFCINFMISLYEMSVKNTTGVLITVILVLQVALGVLPCQ